MFLVEIRIVSCVNGIISQTNDKIVGRLSIAITQSREKGGKKAMYSFDF